MPLLIRIASATADDGGPGHRTDASETGEGRNEDPDEAAGDRTDPGAVEPVVRLMSWGQARLCVGIHVDAMFADRWIGNQGTTSRDRGDTILQWRHGGTACGRTMAV